jgi:hypothetical protein
MNINIDKTNIVLKHHINITLLIDIHQLIIKFESVPIVEITLWHHWFIVSEFVLKV